MRVGQERSEMLTANEAPKSRAVGGGTSNRKISIKGVDGDVHMSRANSESASTGEDENETLQI